MASNVTAGVKRMDSFCIDTANEREIALAHALHCQVVPNPWRFETFVDSTTTPYCLRVVRQREKLIGYAIVLMVADEATLIDIGIHTAARGQQAGRRLLHDVINYCATHNMATLWLEVRASNHVAISLYTSSGFKLFETRKGYYPAADSSSSAEDALIMSCTLNPEN
tara:strand:- start:59 stop:559 length:501 start_codon:yes stop_codon:yes gene_type:complete